MDLNSNSLPVKCLEVTPSVKIHCINSDNLASMKLTKID